MNRFSLLFIVVYISMSVNKCFIKSDILGLSSVALKSRDPSGNVIVQTL